MLSRAARRRYALQYFRQAAEQIQLPWLCPALQQHTNRVIQIRPVTSRPALPRSPPTSPSSTSTRHLASAASLPEDFDSNDEYLPFSYGGLHEPLPRDVVNKSFSSTPFLSSHLEPIDLRKILMIDNTTAVPPVRISSSQQYGIEISGDTREIETTLDACLQVQRWDRAFALLKQLNFISQATKYDAVHAYNHVLQAMVTDMVSNRNNKNVEKITNWVEVYMKQAGVDPDAKTYALKVKVALATLTGSKRDRTVRRYWEMAKQHGFDGEAASLRDILTDSDLGSLSEIGLLRYESEAGMDEYEPEVALELSLEENIAHRAPVQIMETSQKGMGLSTLKKSMSLFSEVKHLEDHEPLEGSNKVSKQKYAEARQARLESDAVESAVARWKVEHEKMAKMGVTINLQHGKIGALLWRWHELLTEKLRKEMLLVEQAEAKAKKSPQDRARCEYGPFLRLLPLEHIAALTTIAVFQIVSKNGIHNVVMLASLVTELGKILESEVEADKLRDNLALRRLMKRRQEAPPEISPETPAFPRHRSTHSSSSTFIRQLHWTNAIHARIGAILCELLFESARIPVSEEDGSGGRKIPVVEPVFKRQVNFQNGKKRGCVVVHEAMIKMMVAQPAGDLIAKQLPMVCPPKPWKGFYNGGFLEAKHSFLRIKAQETSQRDYGEAAANRGDLDQLFAGLDVLGRTAWKINRDVFEVMLQAWNSGQAIANLPPIDKVFPTPPKPAENADAKTKYEYYRAMRAIDDERGGIHSNRCFQNFQMEIAKAYADETFYLPHNIDFRGRAYPIPPYLNQMGADNCRGLLLFAKGRQLGESGLRWLKIHLANVYGFDKASLDDRANFPMEHLEDILDSVKNPLDGKRWWLTAEDPWQCLAVSMELKKALELSDPGKYVSYLPVHQDGSCNGLQHYAALGGDIVGARQVNLEPGDKPADVYTGVAELVKAEITQDAAKGDAMAQMLEGRITRKIVKQTVMTNVYGVTFLGAIRQVRKQLDEYHPDLKEKQISGTAATYIARKIFKGLGAMFAGAHDIQYWLGDCANRISMSVSPAQQKKLLEQEERGGLATSDSKASPARPKRLAKLGKTTRKLDPASFRSSVIWTTPLKLPVVQPYRVNKGQRIKTNLQDITLAEPSVADAVNKRKQLQAFPPNFIHSLDATHMVLSALKADELGLTFSAVHDSFWTHAADVDILSRLLREAFIRMHSEDIIGRLAAEFKMRYKGHLYFAQIRKEGELGQKIGKYRRGLKYKRGTSVAERKDAELLREIRRQKLLLSDKAEDRAEGKQMVTAASLFEDMGPAGENELHTKDSLGETAIGRVPEKTSELTIGKALEAESAGTVDGDVNMQVSLEPLMEHEMKDERDSQEDADVELEADVVVDAEEDFSAKKEEKPKRKVKPQPVWLWLPMAFRAVPKKGDFDVTRLRESQYFFS